MDASLFVVGEIYRTSGWADFPYRVVKRTEKSVWVKDLVLDCVMRRKVHLYSDGSGEYVEVDNGNILPAHSAEIAEA